MKNLLLKYKISIAVLTETEVPHDIAKTFNIDGYTVYCPPSFTTGPKGKEAGLILLVSNDISSSIILRHDLNNEVDTIPTISAEKLEPKIRHNHRWWVLALQTINRCHDK